MEDLTLRIISHNVRYATKNLGPGERPWEERLPLVLKQLKFHTRYASHSLLCLQEVLHSQLQGLLDGLRQDAADWTSIGVGREDGKEDGEYSPILYRSSIWELQKRHTFWLSETPDRPSKGWDAANVRLATLGLFKDRSTGQQLVAINTHFDHRGTVARHESARLIVQEARKWTAGPQRHPVVLAGDMNSTEDQEAYKVLSSSDSRMMDMLHMCGSSQTYGYSNTWTGFDGNGNGEGLKRIDFVFLSECEGRDWKAKGYAIPENRFEDGVYLSDHRAVIADVELSGSQ